MTKAEVEAIFGVSAGDYDWAKPDDESDIFALLAARDVHGLVEWMESNQIQRILLNRIASADSHETLPPCVWLGRHGACTIHSDHHQRVIERRYFWPKVRIESPWTRWWATLRGQQ